MRSSSIVSDLSFKEGPGSRKFLFTADLAQGSNVH